MSADTVLPIEVLREIRDAVEKMGARLSERIDSLDKSLGSRIDQTNARLEALDRRVTQGFIETNTKVADLSGRVQQLGENVDKLGARLENILLGQFGQEVRDLRQRMLVVEEKLMASGLHERGASYGPKTEK